MMEIAYGKLLIKKKEKRDFLATTPLRGTVQCGACNLLFDPASIEMYFFVIGKFIKS